ncbi:serine hydrolase domain-containing protein [Novosphingobium huizhouense]|uniref:serine hydrolase domain-containing protein n=1 Tax=Novosphingobium huizhouense TaxID=2866625 RepID=UPI001CD89793|nr:serine hydrolase domain-containing protein [Novosphingobium huizhouense]
MIVRALAAVGALLAAMGAPVSASAQPARIAVAFDAHRLRPVVVEGLADRQTGRAVGADDPVRIASISKLVTALGVMRLVDRRRLDLDADVSRWLGWRLRNPAFPDRPVTLRMLLSHLSSLVDDADYVIPLGETVRTRLADPKAWDRAHPPGSDWFHYTNLNFPVVASVMEAATGERFDRLMQRLVLRPLHLSACFNWSGCSPEVVARAVVLHGADGEVRRDDLHGAPPPCLVATAPGLACDLAGYVPGTNGALFSPQGGLRISANDLARIGQMLARGGRGFLSHAAFAEMTRAQWRFDGRNGVDEGGEAGGIDCAYGLGVHILTGRNDRCRDDLFGDGRTRIGHSGEAYGLRSGLWVDPATGRGLAFFVTAVPDAAPPAASSAFTAAEEALVRQALLSKTP